MLSRLKRLFNLRQRLPSRFSGWPSEYNPHASPGGRLLFHHFEVCGQHWLHADQPAAADEIYVGLDYPNDSQGMGGAIVTFRLVEGGTLTLYGPWCTNPRDYHDATGVDLENRYATRGVIAKTVDKLIGPGLQKPTMDYRDLLYLDYDWRLGDFDRLEKLAQEYAVKFGEPVYYYAQLYHGAYHSRKLPAYRN